MLATTQLLKWLYIGRLMLAGGVVLTAAFGWSPELAQGIRLAAAMFVLAVVVTALGLWHTRVRRQVPERNFLYSQVVFDVVLVTSIVHLTGGSDSDFAPLYIPLIAAAALLLPLPGGMLVGALAIVLYVADIVWGHHAELTETVFLQIPLFAVMALATAWLGDRLRRTGRALGVVESELRQLRLDTGDILGTLETGVVSVDGDGRLVYINPAGESLLSLPARRWLGEPVLAELDRKVPGMGAAIRRTAETGVPVRRYETRASLDAEADDGGPGGDAGGRAPVAAARILGVRTTVLEREDATPWITAVFQDITDSRRAEALHRRAERLEAVAELASSLAHEIRNPLASIRSAIEQLSEERLPPADRAVLQRLVLRESDRLSRLLSEFLDYSRVEVRRRDVVDMAALARHVVQLVAEHPDGAEGATVDLITPPGPFELEGDEDLLHRAVFNLILNGVQQAGRQGNVRVELRHADRAELPAGLRLARPVRLSVSDSGPGVPEDALPRIFDPFFTTRPGGTGLGLAVVHRAVQAHDGAIFVNGRSPLGGAEFVVYLPGRAGDRSP